MKRKCTIDFTTWETDALRHELHVLNSLEVPKLSVYDQSVVTNIQAELDRRTDEASDGLNMNYEELSKSLHDELDALLASLKGVDPEEGVVDLNVKVTSATDDEIIVMEVMSELVELTDGTWVIEESHMKTERYPLDTPAGG